MKKVQILYPNDVLTNLIHPLFKSEAKGMESKRFMIGVEPLKQADIIIKRGFTIKNAADYPQDYRMIQGWKENKLTLDFSCYFDTIREWTIPSVIVESLDYEDEIKEILKTNKWNKAFIKSKNASLFALGDEASVFPLSSLEFMKSHYEEWNESGPFIIRQFIDEPEIFYNEQRYWVLNGHSYHPTGKVPQFVKTAGEKLYEFSGSKYFTIDVAGEYIVEVNPGESSDRGGDNPLDFFCEIFSKEFLG